MLLSGVITVPPREIVDPLIVIPEFTRELFGRFVTVLRDPESEQVSNVLLVNVCVCVK